MPPSLNAECPGLVPRRTGALPTKWESPAVRDVRGPDEDHGDRGGGLVVSRLVYQRAEGAEVSYTAKLDNGRGSVAGAPR